MTEFRNMSVTKFLLLLFGVFFSYILLVVIVGESGAPQNLIYILQILFYVVLFFAFFNRGLTSQEQKKVLTSDKKTFSLPLMMAPFFIGSLVSVLYGLVIQFLFPSLFESYLGASESIELMIEQAGYLQIGMIFLAIVVLAPIVEEILFRGILFNLIARRKSTLFAMITSSLIFGFLHAETMVPTAVIGFVLCFIYHKTGNLYLAMGAHAFNNLIAFVMPLLLAQASETSALVSVLGVLLLLANGVITILFARYLIKNWGSIRERTPFFRLSHNQEGDIGQRDKEAEKEIIDITKHIRHGMDVYPGDPEVVVEEKNSISQDGFSLRKLSLSTHSGTHMDFPSHFIENGKTADDFELERFFGETAVVSSFQDPIPYGVKNILSKEGYLTEDRARMFLKNGVQLIGTVHESIEQDYPYPLHKLLLESDIIILENLELRHVEPGIYRLVVLPLKIEGAEASPCRAVLFR
ncbi:type II CAAX prenyl endopeptidase Rce1 family protein [Proteiniclasticum sp.]|uniref:CPBP family glutamic-type intramembrane protease n=1 Tax=Proteiniclasticum sp. TaxID=2053595 RepID=UPI00289D235B|nr:CPBP family glutamic-type intramembrane protease [Proteiniclasticum sp.]